MQRVEPPRGWKPQDMDTAYGPESLQFDHWRALEPWQKVEVICGLNRMCEHLATLGVRMHEPAIGDQELKLRVAARIYGEELAARLRAQTHRPDPS